MRRLIDQIPATIQLKNVRPGRFIDGASKAKVCVDGRGFAFISPVDQFSSRVDRNSVRIAPAYVPVGAVERRLTKKRDLHRSQLVLGHSCVATIEDPNGHRGFDAGDLCLVPPSFEAGSDVVGPGVSGVDGYLRSSVEIDIQKITPLPGLGQPHLWLLAIPLSIVVSASDLIDELEGDLEKLHACIWGAGTLGMLFGWYLRRLGWAVSIADIYPMNSLVARSVEQLGAAYVGPEFDWIPEEVAPLGISVTTEISKRESRRKSIDQLLISVAEMDSRCRRLVVHRSGGLRFAKMPAVSHDHIPEAVRTIATNSEFPWGDLVSGIDPLSRYDAAIFPATPSRLRIVAVQS
jgi:hypothetical protein